MSDTNPIVTLLSFLYCNHVFFEFRQPVLTTYPDILEVYLSKIQNPIDLGTLLSQALQNELTVDALRLGLQTIVANALTYNAGYPLIEAISRHLGIFAKSVFEEVLQKPYETDKLNQTTDEFQAYLWKERKRRYTLLQSIPLNSFELLHLQKVLRDVALTSFSYATLLISASNLIDQKLEEIDVLKRKLAEEAAAAAENPNQDEEEEPYDPFPVFPTVTLHDIIQLILKDITDQTPSSAALLPPTAKIFPLLEIYSFTPVKKFYGVLELLDNYLGIFLTQLEERFFRGASFCTRWSVPHDKLVWAPLPERTKNKPWVPAMILVSNSVLFPMTVEVMEKNIERFPKDLVKELVKCRPRPTGQTPSRSATKDNKANSTDATEDEEAHDEVVDGEGAVPMETDDVTSNNHTTTATPSKQNTTTITTQQSVTPSRPIAPPVTSLSCPDGYVLLEFFGEHDLAWMKADICAPMDMQGKIPKFSKTCSQAVFEDAEDVRLLVEKFYASHGEYPYDGTDLTAIPALETIQAAVTLSDELQQAIKHFQEKGVAPGKKRRASAGAGGSEKKRSTAAVAAAEEERAAYFIDGGYYSEDHLNGSEERKPVARKRNTPKKSTTQSADHDGEGDGDGNSEHISPTANSISPGNGEITSRLRGMTRKIPEIYDKNRSNLSKVNTPSKLLPRDFQRLPQFQDRFIIGNKLFISRAPLPVPIDTMKFSSPLPGYHFKFGINFRRNATLRSRALAMYLNQIKPLNITIGDKNEGDEVDELETSNAPTKRGRKSNQEKAAAAAAAAAMTIDKLNQRPVLDLSLESLEKIPREEFFAKKWGTFIESGCSRFYYGKGLAYARVVDLNHPIFFRESRDEAKRKEALQREIGLVTKLTERLLSGEDSTDESEPEADGKEKNEGGDGGAKERKEDEEMRGETVEVDEEEEEGEDDEMDIE